MVGPEHAGKTTLLYRFKLGEHVQAGKWYAMRSLMPLMPHEFHRLGCEMSF